MEELLSSHLVIQGVNKGDKVQLVIIRLELNIGELKSNFPFETIDARTIYNVLLGCPWIHENGIVLLTLY